MFFFQKSQFVLFWSFSKLFFKHLSCVPPLIYYSYLKFSHVLFVFFFKFLLHIFWSSSLYTQWHSTVFIIFNFLVFISLLFFSIFFFTHHSFVPHWHCIVKVLFLARFLVFTFKIFPDWFFFQNYFYLIFFVFLFVFPFFSSFLCTAIGIV